MPKGRSKVTDVGWKSVVFVFIQMDTANIAVVGGFSVSFNLLTFHYF